METMIIQTNGEGKKAIEGLCDVALKVGGLQNYQVITQILHALKPLPPQVTEPVLSAEAK